jgi:hypothetical protein
VFIVSIVMVILGYTLLYYGVGLWNYYRINGGTGAITPNELSTLFGLNQTGGTPKLPFDESGSGAAPATNTITPSTTTGGSGVQSV